MPYTFYPTKKYHSSVLGGVTITLRKMTERRRLELQIAIAEPQAKLSSALERMSEMKALDKASESRDHQVEIMKLESEVNQIITREMNPARLKWGVAGISGLKLGEDDATVDNLMDWPSDLIQELLTVIDEGSMLSEVHVKNSESATTSGEAEGGPTNDTTAASAS